ncbi:MAG: dTDP-4-dehydrorhamnose reductase, partial [Pirellulaceae bacterium]
MSIPLPLLVTGIAGVAGYNAFQYFREKFPGQVVGLRRVNNWPLSGDGIEPCDMYDFEQLTRLFDKYQFGSVLNGEGTCALRACELDPTLAHKVNVQGINSLLDVIDGTDTRLVHVSIDLVFSGVADGGYKETCPTDPVTVYGKTMVEAEDAILMRRPQSCILRMSLPMGVSFNGHAGAIDWIQSRF